MTDPVYKQVCLQTHQKVSRELDQYVSGSVRMQTSGPAWLPVSQQIDVNVRREIYLRIREYRE